MARGLALILLLAANLLARPAGAENRDLLWRVVQACVLNHSLTGAAFPCLAVETAKGVERGYAVVRAPKDATRIVVVPTARTPGIEAARLLGREAPNYFEDAWSARHFVTDGMSTPPSRGDLAMAVNSQRGRSQDQLHIHLACIRDDVKRTILSQRHRIRPDRWTRIHVLPQVAYAARFVPGDDLSHINPFDQAAKGLNVDPEDMDGVTIVVLAVTADPASPTSASSQPAGFILMTRQRRNEADSPHGEGLLDPACTAFRASSG